MEDSPQPIPPTIIDRVRHLMPVRTLTLLDRPLSRAEAETVAEQQAIALLRLLKINKPDVEIELVTELPGIEVAFVPDLPQSGTSDWIADDDGGYWLVAIRSSESLWRCRASLAHELKHILDDPFREVLYPEWPRDAQQPAPRRAERLSDYFAGCVLVPETWLRQAWEAGFRSLPALAGLFVVSESMIQTRLAQVGLVPRWRRMPQMPEWHQYTRERPVANAMTARTVFGSAELEHTAIGVLETGPARRRGAPQTISRPGGINRNTGYRATGYRSSVRHVRSRARDYGRCSRGACTRVDRRRRITPRQPAQPSRCTIVRFWSKAHQCGRGTIYRAITRVCQETSVLSAVPLLKRVCPVMRTYGRLAAAEAGGRAARGYGI